ncbi:MAG: DUF3102 domain-containing protein [Waterburya sp.]
MNNRVDNTQIINNFDYNILESEQRLIVQQKTQEIKEGLKRSAQDIWEIGQKISEVRSQISYGHFDKWLKVEFGWSRRTAYNFIQVYEAFPERATVAQVNIAASALYQLSSPSIPKEVRKEFIKKAKEGEKVTRENIRKALKQEQSSSINTVATKQEGNADSKQQIISIVPKATSAIKLLVKEKQTQESVDNSTDIFSFESELCLKSWYELGKLHFLFYGDTASPEFYETIPQVSLAIAITSIDWDHDWLIDKAENLLILKESFLEKESISTLISLFSEPGDMILFPWLPDENMIDSAHKLGRIIVAGDPILKRCQKAIAISKLTIEPILVPKKI